MIPVQRRPAIHTPNGYEADKEEDPTKLPRCEYFTRYPSTSIYRADVERVHHYSRSEAARHHKESAESDGIKFTPYPLTLRNIDKARTKLITELANLNVNITLPANNIEVKLQFLADGSGTVMMNDGLLRFPKGYFFDKKLKKLSLPIFPESSYIEFELVLDAVKLPKEDATGTAVSAHTGGFASPYHLQKYATNIRSNRFDTTRFPITAIVYNELLEYRKRMCCYIAAEYTRKRGADYGKANNDSKYTREVVSFSNDYPCVLVRFNYRTDNKSVTSDELKNTFFKRYNYMLMAYFIAIVDYSAFKTGIEIEMVARSSFGHNNPTIDVTDKSFRINIGLVPKAYADIIVNSLIKLYNLFELLENPTTIHLVMNPELRTKLNLGRSGGNFTEPELPHTYWQSLWAKGSQGNTGIKMIGELVGREGGYRSDLLANFVLKAIIENPVEFFTTPRLAESPIGKLFEYVEYGSTCKVLQLSETVYKNQSVRFKQQNPIFYDGSTSKFYVYTRAKVGNKLQDIIIELLFNTVSLEQKNNLIADVLANSSIHHERLALLFTNFEKEDGGIMSANNMRNSLATWLDTNHQHWLESRQASGMKIEADPPLCEIVKTLCTALCVDFPTGIEVKFLYKFLERANLEFVQNVRTRNYNPGDAIPEWGSDSDIEPAVLANSKPVYSKKVIVANGMLALNLAYYAARVAWSVTNAFDQGNWQRAIFERNMQTKFTVNIENTYFELEDCLMAAVNPPSIISGGPVQILFFDLNSFNAQFIEQRVDLTAKLIQTKPQIVVLDHTSTTTDRIREAVDNILNNHLNVYLILLVSSGLKNEQGGADNNPYGRVTIVTRGDNKNLRDFVYNEVTRLRGNGLSDKALLPRQAHMIRHSHKDRKIAPSSKDFCEIPLPKPVDPTPMKPLNAGDLPQENQASPGQKINMPGEPPAQMDVNYNHGAPKPIGITPAKELVAVTSKEATPLPKEGPGSPHTVEVTMPVPLKPLDYATLANQYEKSFDPGKGWKLKYVSGEGGVSGIRSVFIVVFGSIDYDYATCASSQIRVELVTKIRDRLLLTHNGMTPQQKIIEIFWQNKIYGLLITDSIKSLAKLNKLDRQNLLQLFLHLFHGGMSQRDHGAIETLLHRNIVTIDDPNTKYLLANCSRIVMNPANTTEFNHNIMEFCMGYLEQIRSRSINEGEDLLEILAIILQRKIFVATEAKHGAWRELLVTTHETTFPHVYLHYVDVSLDPTKPPNHYNVFLNPTIR